MARPTLPDTATVGDAGHTTDHNTIAAALTELYDEVRLGAGTPEGAVTAAVGTLYRDTTNGLLYMKESGAGNTGWLPYAPTRITRPNTDDRLVEAYNGGAWSVVEYDSGWRDVSALIASSWTVGTGGDLSVRRTLDTVHVTGSMLKWPSATMNTGTPFVYGLGGFFEPISAPSAWGYPTGLGTYHMAYSASVIAPVFTISGERLCIIASGLPTADNGGNNLWFSITYRTTAGIPTSLPGTLVSAAPA